ncbi:hypothetical protein BD408DRAFT_464758 [Parasitella parasitica]|nr:hypothetical protein BD408DRAFT_464758 [Parasitella parasitica]
MAQNTSTPMLLDFQSTDIEYDYSYEDLDEIMNESDKEMDGTFSSPFVSLLNAVSRSSPEQGEVTMGIDSEAHDILMNDDEEEPVSAKPELADKYYRNYKVGQKIDFIRLILDMKSVKEAAAITGIKLKTAYGLRDYWNTYGEIPKPMKRGPKLSTDLKEEHVEFIVNIIDQWASTTLDSMREQLMNNFPGLKVHQK